MQLSLSSQLSLTTSRCLFSDVQLLRFNVGHVTVRLSIVTVNIIAVFLVFITLGACCCRLCSNSMTPFAGTTGAMGSQL